MTNNSTNKLLIKYLTLTHTKPTKAYKQAIQYATMEQVEQIKKIAKAFNINI